MKREEQKNENGLLWSWEKWRAHPRGRGMGGAEKRTVIRPFRCEGSYQ